MAWRCSALTNDGLVDNLARAGIVQSRRVVDAMKATDRAQYMASDPSRQAVAPQVAYMDAPQHIGHRQTISAPHMVPSDLDASKPPYSITHLRGCW
jgi:protein-L-isoaspartate(D-aspartate) O-methyltransferase